MYYVYSSTVLHHHHHLPSQDPSTTTTTYHTFDSIPFDSFTTPPNISISTTPSVRASTTHNTTPPCITTVLNVLSLLIILCVLHGVIVVCIYFLSLSPLSFSVRGWVMNHTTTTTNTKRVVERYYLLSSDVCFHKRWCSSSRNERNGNKGKGTPNWLA
mmetsp:Transcript_44330/g.49449  ORF Transcript_44330/g.49449 Transcript_44330/m.49449 type:complete len:158 (+) Transcript_44330:1369-1842(+)